MAWFRKWEESRAQEQVSLLDSVWVIELQEAYRHTSRRRERFDVRSVEVKMIRPTIPTGVEQGDDLAGIRVDGGEIGALAPVAEVAIALPLNVTGLDPRWIIQ